MRRKTSTPSRFPRKKFTGPSRTPPQLWSTASLPFHELENNIVPEGETPSPTPAMCSAPGSTGVQGSDSGPSKKRKKTSGQENHPPTSWYARETVGQLRPKQTIRSVEVSTPTLTTITSAPPTATTVLTGNYDDASEENRRARGHQRKHPPLASQRSLGSPPPIATPGTNFRPHMVTVNPGENVGNRIFQFTRKGKREICILSASGAVSDVKLWQLDGGTVTHKGCYNILSLSASLVSPTRGLYVTLMAENGLQTIGGVVSDPLIAASPILIVIGTFTLKRTGNKTIDGKEDKATSSTQEVTATSTSPEAIPAGCRT